MDSNVELTRAFVMELLRTGLMLTDGLAGLIEDLPEDAYPGEDTGDVVVGMLVGSLLPVTAAAGGRTVEQAIALLGATADKYRADLRAALEVARRSEGSAP
jgi:hypothetical protein